MSFKSEWPHPGARRLQPCQESSFIKEFIKNTAVHVKGSGSKGFPAALGKRKFK